MTELVCKPEKASVVKGRGLYEVYMNRKPLGLHIRAKNAGEADEMLRFVFTHELTDKNLDFRIEDFKEGNDGEDMSLQGDDRSEADQAFHEVAPLPPPFV